MKMEKPTAEAVRFTSADVIATSGGVRLSEIGNNKKRDNMFQVGNQPFYSDSPDGGVSSVPLELINALNRAGGSGDDASDIWFYSNDEPNNLESLWNDDDDDWKKIFNGTYTWQSGTYGDAWYWYKNN